MSDWTRPRKQPTMAQMREVNDMMLGLAEIEFETDADEAFVLWWETESGQVQPVIWPMAHRHTQECNRA